MKFVWRIVTIILGAVLFTAPAAIAGSVPAQASGCHIFSNNLTGYGLTGGDYWTWTPTFTVPSTSTCQDVQVRYLDPTNCYTINTVNNAVYVAVQFYVAGAWQWSGPSTVTSCNSSYWRILAYSVPNGTKYRILIKGYNPFSTSVMD